jgi:hypothetical protein
MLFVLEFTENIVEYIWYVAFFFVNIIIKVINVTIDFLREINMFGVCTFTEKKKSSYKYSSLLIDKVRRINWIEKRRL